MYWDGGWAWMAFMPLVWIAVVGLAAWAVVRLAQRPAAPDHRQGKPDRESPEEILDRRFASGEIDADTYTKALESLAARHERGAKR